jgi:hypothetical protein
MQEKKRKFPLSIPEIILLIIFIPVIFYKTMRGLIKPMNSYAPYWFSTVLGFLVVLGFDTLWVIAMKLSSLENIRIKIYLTLIVLTFSASVLACWVLLNLLSGSW